jgi:putative phosphoribosyl transferase
MTTDAGSTSVAVPVDHGALEGDLTVPPGAEALVLFAHGSGSSRHSPRNRAVAAQLNDARLATLLIDLLTEEEEQAERETRHLRFDVNRDAQRRMRVEAQVEIVPGASHLFEEPGALEAVSRLAARWFQAHLPVG